MHNTTPILGDTFFAPSNKASHIFFYDYLRRSCARAVIPLVVIGALFLLPISSVLAQEIVPGDTATKPYSVVFLGDSIALGQNSGAPLVDGFVAKVQRYLNQQTNTSNLGFQSVYKSSDGLSLSSDNPKDACKDLGFCWTFPSKWQYYGVYHVGGTLAQYKGANFSIAHGNNQVDGPALFKAIIKDSKEVDIRVHFGKLPSKPLSPTPGVYYGSVAGMTVSVGSTLLGTIPSDSGSQAETYGNIQEYTYSPTADEVAQGYFTIQFMPQDENYVAIEGVNIVSDHNGIVVHQIAHAGVKAWSYGTNTVGQYGLRASTSVFNPDMLVIELGVNDLYTGYSPESIKTYISNIATQSGLSGNKIIIMGMGQPPANVPNASQWPAVIASLKTLASANGYQFLSVYDRWLGSESIYQDGTVHPNLAGHADIAQFFLESVALPIPNHPPKINGTTWPTLVTGKSYNFRLAGYDADKYDVLGMNIINFPAGFSKPTCQNTIDEAGGGIKRANCTFGGVFTTAGTYQVTTEVYDKYGVTNSSTATIKVLPPNYIPQINATVWPTLTLGRIYSLRFAGYDKILVEDPNEELSMTISDYPPGLEIQPCSLSTEGSLKRITCLVTGRPTQSGTYYPILKIQDGRGGTSEMKSTVTVN